MRRAGLLLGLLLLSSQAEAKVLFENENQEVLLLITNEGDILLRGKVIGHDEEIGRILTEYDEAWSAT